MFYISITDKIKKFKFRKKYIIKKKYTSIIFALVMTAFGAMPIFAAEIEEDTVVSISF